MTKVFQVGLLLFLLSVGLMFYIYQQIDPAPEKRLRIATGRESGVYYAYAQAYKKRLEAEGIKVEIETTAGSQEVLSLLRDKRVDIGFVQGGVAREEDKTLLRSLCSIYTEPVWFFYRASLGKKFYFNDFVDVPLSVGEEGSGTMALATKVLASTDIMTQRSKIHYLDTEASYQAFKAGEIDGFFLVSAVRSPLIEEMLLDSRLAHLDLRRLDAFTQNYTFLRRYEISEGSLNMRKNIPSRDMHLLATTATLVTHNEVDSMLVRLMTMVAKQGKVGSEYPSMNYLEIPIHEASKRYLVHGVSFLERFLPYWVASNIDRLKYMLIPLLTLLLPLFKGLLPLYRWRWHSKIYRWYARVDALSRAWESFDSITLQERYEMLSSLILEIKSSTDVPLSFKGEYYTLEMHIDNVMQRMQRKLDGERYSEVYFR